jgi:hypothetical protein
LFDHWKLVVPDRNQCCLERRNVCGLADRIREEACRNIALEPAKADLFLDRRVAFQPRDRYQVEQILRQLGQFGHLRLDKDGRQVRINTGGKVVKRDFDNAVCDLLVLAYVVRHCLRVGQQQILLCLVLEFYAGAKRADVMTEVKWTGGAVTGQDNGFC